MKRHSPLIFMAILAVTGATGGAEARNRPPADSMAPLLEGSPTLAPFQHVRFCLRYPADCKTDSAASTSIDLDARTTELLKQVNHSVNMSIVPKVKDYGPNLADGWTVGPNTGDCNDYAVTKRHELMQSGLPSKALRLSVVKIPSGVGHLVLVVSTTRGDIVLDNLTEAIRPWQRTGYQWLKIQSAADAKFWYVIKTPEADLALADQKVHVADR
jgi:predicted transglutaminase-like cysteine proteinase